MNLLGIVFGVSMLLPGLLSLPVVACVLLIMGPLLFVPSLPIAEGGANGSDRRTTGNLITFEARLFMGAFVYQ